MVSIISKFSKILVTGGAGFVGSHLVYGLIRQGYDVIVLDNLYSGSLANIRQHLKKKTFQYVNADILDYNMVSKLVKDIDAVFHEAALVSVSLSIEDPFLANRINVIGTLNLLKASVESKIKRFICASSAAVYGDTQNPEITEEMPANPLSPYGVSKLAAENYVSAFNKTYGLETVSLRYFNIYGPRQRFDIGGTYGGVISIFLNRILQNMPPIIHGDGNQTRDFVYIDDVVEANMLAMASKNASGQVFNIGTGTRLTINELSSLLKDITNRKHLTNVYAPAQPGSILHSSANISKARRILGYEPKFSIRDGLTELVKWYKTRDRDSQT